MHCQIFRTMANPRLFHQFRRPASAISDGFQGVASVPCGEFTDRPAPCDADIEGPQMNADERKFELQSSLNGKRSIVLQFFGTDHWPQISFTVMSRFWLS